jgi:quaternary ammonium compound-resistance protein SugE
MSWIYLLIAGLLEIGFTTFLKLADGFTRPIMTGFFFLFSLMSFLCLNKSLETIPLGVAYAVWTGIGAAGTACVGIYFFGEHLSPWKVVFLSTLVGSIFGLKVLS